MAEGTLTARFSGAASKIELLVRDMVMTGWEIDSRSDDVDAARVVLSQIWVPSFDARELEGRLVTRAECYGVACEAWNLETCG